MASSALFDEGADAAGEERGSGDAGLVVANGEPCVDEPAMPAMITAAQVCRSSLGRSGCQRANWCVTRSMYWRRSHRLSSVVIAGVVLVETGSHGKDHQQSRNRAEVAR
jgi:hypothetical protein